MFDQHVIGKLKSLTGPKGWLEGADTKRYTEDPRGRIAGVARLVLRPASVSEVSEVLRLCNGAGVGIIPFGGGTGGANGHLDPCGQHVVLSLERMNRIRSISAQDASITVEAGVKLGDVHNAVDDIGGAFGLSLASEGSCTIGGNLASNAGGVQTLRYGNARDLCLGLEAVMADGSILSGLEPLRKDNTGYDLRHLLIGSEGTLGVITAATLKVSPKPKTRETVVCAVPSPAAALDLLNALRCQIGEVVSAFELMSALGMSLALKHFPDLRHPFTQDYPWYVLADVAAPENIQDKLEAVLANALEKGLIEDAIVATSGAQAAALWALRENAFEYNRQERVIYSSDTSVPLSNISAFVSNVQESLADWEPSLRVNCYGHVGDGNIHVNVFAATGAHDAFLESQPNAASEIAEIIEQTTVSLGGSISAEHGIGRAKIDTLQKYGDPTKLAMMRRIKQAFDPKGILNPGALL
jgi:FAD/FMN-containing dehydrogenase